MHRHTSKPVSHAIVRSGRSLGGVECSDFFTGRRRGYKGRGGFQSHCEMLLYREFACTLGETGINK
jgi:hypothetical protein